MAEPWIGSLDEIELSFALELAEAKVEAKKKLAAAGKLDPRWMGRRDPLCVELLGFAGELAAENALRLKGFKIWAPNVRVSALDRLERGDVTDDGIDIEFHSGGTANVRTRDRRERDLLSPDANIFSAELGILMWPFDAPGMKTLGGCEIPSRFELVGFLTRETARKRATHNPKGHGYGPDYTVRWQELAKPEKIQEWLRGK